METPSGKTKTKKVTMLTWRSSIATELLHHPTLSQRITEGLKTYGNID